MPGFHKPNPSNSFFCLSHHLNLVFKLVLEVVMGGNFIFMWGKQNQKRLHDLTRFPQTELKSSSPTPQPKLVGKYKWFCTQRGERKQQTQWQNCFFPYAQCRRQDGTIITSYHLHSLSSLVGQGRTLCGVADAGM